MEIEVIGNIEINELILLQFLVDDLWSKNYLDTLNLFLCVK